MMTALSGIVSETLRKRQALWCGLLCAAVLALAPAVQATTYYLQASGTSHPETVGNWKDGRTSGTAATVFTGASDVFVIQGTAGVAQTVTGTAAWSVTGTVEVEGGGTLIQGDGTTSQASVLFTFGTFKLDPSGLYRVNLKYTGTSGNGSTTLIPGTTKTFDAASTVQIDMWGDGTGTTPGALPASVTWGNLKINVATLGGAWQWSGNVVTINGTLTLTATGGQVIRFDGGSHATTVTILGDLIINGGSCEFGSSTSQITINLGGNFNMTSGALTEGNTLDLIYFTGGANTTPTFTQSGGTFTISKLNFQVASGKTLTLANNLPVASGRSLTVDSGGTLATGLTFAPVSGSTITINGTFQINQGGFASTQAFSYGASSTLIFNHGNSTYGPIGSSHAYWPSSSGPVNVTVNNGGASCVVNLGVTRTVTGTFQTAAGITLSSSAVLNLNGTNQINVGGFFNNAPTYGSSSTLKYNTGTTYGRGTEWSATGAGTIGSTVGYPNNVQLSGNTTLNLGANSGTGTARALAGSLTIDSGSIFEMSATAGNAMTQAATVAGSVTNNGTLRLSGSSGGDINVGGNWSLTGTFTPNNRTVTFNGSSAQTITGATTFDYLTMNNSAGLTLNNACIVNQVLTLTAGKITTTAANLLTLANNTTDANGLSGGSSTSFINGPLARAYSTGISKNFPLGDGTANYVPVSVNITTLSGTPTVTVTPNVPSAFGGSTPASTTLFGIRNWNVVSSIAGPQTITLGVNNTGFTPSGTGQLIQYNGTATTPLTTTFGSSTYSAANIALGTTTLQFALGDFVTPSITAGTVTGFGNQQVNTTSTTKTYSLSGASLSPASGNITVTPPANFEVSPNGSTWTANPSSLNVAYSGGALSSTTISVRFKPTAVTSYSGNITYSGGGVSSPPTTALSGTGTALAEPTLSAAVSLPSTINLTIGLNTAGNNVVVVYNNTGTFTVPSGAPGSLGSSFAGGTLLQNSTSTTYSHTPLTQGTYFYKAWSYDSTGNLYSPAGVTANATVPGIYYSQTSGDPTALGNWNSQRDGSGSAPSSFTGGDAFIIQGTGNGGTTPHTMTASSGWSLTGTAPQIQIEVGGKLITGGTISLSSGGSVTVNGTFQINQGGFASGGTWTYGSSGTLIYNNTSGVYGAIDSGHTYWPSASGPVNVTVQGAGGINMGVARTVTGTFQTAAVVQGTALTLNGTAKINAGGSFSAGAAPIYGSSSTLIYNTGGTFARSTEWSASGVQTIGTTAGYPNNVLVSNSTTINFPNGSGTARACAGSLLVDAGSALYQDYSSGSAALTVGGNIDIRGGYSLGGAAGGDLTIGGNWTHTNTSSSINFNGRALNFNGTGTQTVTVTGTGGGTVSPSCLCKTAARLNWVPPLQ